jgi:uncharacterized protein YndB with AHSA1/START domain
VSDLVVISRVVFVVLAIIGARLVWQAIARRRREQAIAGLGIIVVGVALLASGATELALLLAGAAIMAAGAWMRDRGTPGVEERCTRIAIFLDAPRPRVYRALLDPEAIERWRVPDGMTARVHEFDARVGGAFRVSLTYDAPDRAGKTTAHTDTYHGRFVELVPDERIVEVLQFETTNDAMRGEMQITYTLSDGVGGGTDLVAEHDHLPPGISVSDNDLGWRMSLEKLSALVQTP